ncbi:hypothetical protein ATE48_01015 [Candidatus Viadribacter manganicus]|uniref:Uncharacterized protein n=1 Tax=Candidatus Viadribacter manganicus TaxID=1759059 RepID=A0A1B1ADG9_9PROT|nr:hypothetical protein ATE48_01015 [Candidatus Viadribacter manganicus]
MAIALGGCVNTPGGDTPEWANAEGFPSLREVPEGGTSANTTAAHWRAVEADLLQARAAAQSNPRAQEPAVAEDPQTFLDEARRDIEATRNSHNPY